MLAIVIPAYNRPELLRDALDSLVCQTQKRFITIVVDDCSEENIQEVVNKYSNRLHIVYLRQSANYGPGAARNRGLKWCIDNNIELVMFLDSDDLLFPKAVERLSKEINITNSNIIISKIQSETKQKIPTLIENSETIWTHGKIYRVSFLKKNNIFFPELKTNEDLGFNTVAFFCALKDKKVSRLNEEHYLWRNTNNSITRQSKDKRNELITQLSKDFIKAVYFSYNKFLELNLDVSQIYNKIIGGIYVYYGFLRALDCFDETDERIIKQLYADAPLKNYIKKEFRKKEKGIFSNINQVNFYMDRVFIFDENIIDYIFKYSDINLRKEL